MSERTLEQALARAEIARQPGACHFYSVATYHDALVDLVLLADEVERLRSDGMTSALSVGEEMGKLHNEVERLRAINTCCPRCHEPLGAPINEFGDYAACSSCGYGSKDDTEISALKERVVEAAIKWRLRGLEGSLEFPIGITPFLDALDALIAAREKASELSPLPDGS